MLDLFSKNEGSTQLTTFSDPFTSDKIDHVNIWIRKNSLTLEITYEADIHFKNNQTSGKHSVTGVDFPTLISNIEIFIKSL